MPKSEKKNILSIPPVLDRIIAAAKVADENNESVTGDTVEIIESRPMSRLKRWQLVKIVSKGNLIDVAALRAAAKESASAGT